MMTPETALYGFFSDMGMPAYPQAAVPDGAELPYLTYVLAVGDWDTGEVNIPVTMWFRTTSEAIPNAAVRTIEERVPRGGVMVSCDGGALWIKRGSPFAQSLLVEGDEEGMKRRYVNIDVEYLTTY